jgi:hypothetical protein
VISIRSTGSFAKTDAFLNRMRKRDILKVLHRYGQVGIAALSAATPRDTGTTANSWGYEVAKEGRTYSIAWSNSNIVNGSPVAILIQYGHGTRTGGYVTGRDYINPAIRPIFDQIANDIWQEVTSA